jgi:hypothetical protein
MKIRPTTFKAACEFVDARHRHHKRPQGHKFSICLMDCGKCVGVAIVGRPVERKHGEFTAQVTRLCTDGTPNACSMLYAACRRICQAMGYDSCNTFTGPGESGTSLTAAGWVEIPTHSSRSWNVKTRPRADKHNVGPRRKWEAVMV